MDFKILQRDKVYSGRAFEVEKVFLELPNKKQSHFDLVDHKNSISVLPIDKNGDVWFVRQYRLGSESQLLELPAGVIEHGEAPEICAMREIQEEIGMAAEKLTFLGDFYLVPGYCNEHMYTYLATDLYPSSLKPDSDEFLQVEKLPYPKVLEMVKTRSINDGKTLATLALAFPILGFPK
ncbi:MAG TPA: NUDIX hydrolase [Anaerolineaceae bacterium]|nr:NUDIX hydrolase [Anaerolineaceae bacterium]